MDRADLKLESNLVTAEICVMNKSAAALAADSAVTSYYDGGYKIFNTANKLFDLGSNHDVGLMFYNNAAFTGVPWEVIINMYRMRIGNKKLSKLTDYVDDLTGYINSNISKWTTAESQYEKLVIAIKETINKRIIARLKYELLNMENNDIIITKDIYSKTVSGIITNALERDGRKNKFDIEINDRKIRKDASHVVDELTSGLDISKKLKNSLLDYALLVVHRQDINISYTGLVMCGYGGEEFYPSTITTCYEFALNNATKSYILTGKSGGVSVDIGANIIAFAQTDMVERFINGTDFDIIMLILGYYSEVNREILNYVGKLRKSAMRDSIYNNISEIGRRMAEILPSRVRNYLQENKVNPIVKAVALLPVDELAFMAESLVNLTSFKRKISMEMETVGGPIDVAIIQKEKGFTWHRRKGNEESKYQKR